MVTAPFLFCQLVQRRLRSLPCSGGCACAYRATDREEEDALFAPRDSTNKIRISVSHRDHRSSKDLEGAELDWFFGFAEGHKINGWDIV